MIHTPLCDLLGIQYPVFQGGMAWIADGKLAAAVSEGGGLGIIAAGNAPAEALREQIQIAKSLTKKPFGVNIMLMSPFVEEVAQLVHKMRQEDNRTILLIEHHMKFVMSLCDQLTVLSSGSVIAEGRPESIQNNEEVIACYLGKRR